MKAVSKWWVVMLVVVGLAVFWGLFFTKTGLHVQCFVETKITFTPYSRLLAWRMARTTDSALQKAGASILWKLASQDLGKAKDVLTVVLARSADLQAYRSRASINLYQRRYAEAVADYRRAMELWDSHDWSTSIRMISNDLVMATMCARIHSNLSSATTSPPLDPGNIWPPAQ